jgi:hypothetical protein
MKDKLKNICYVFPYDLNIHLTFIVSLFMIFCLRFFSCYNMVAKFLLSRLCLLCPCFKFFDPNTQCLHRWSRLWWCMLPQKLFFCYHLPTRGRAGVKLGDAWYNSNVSIILMLHACSYTICFVFCYTSWCFYAFSGTNLLTRCHSASSLFSTIFVFQKSYTENILGIGWNKSRTSYFYWSFAKTKDETEGARSQTHHQGAWPSPWLRPPMVRPPGPTSDDALLPIKSSRREKPKGRFTFSRNILQAAAVVKTRSGGSRISSWHPAREGNPCRSGGDLLSYIGYALEAIKSYIVHISMFVIKSLYSML